MIQVKSLTFNAFQENTYVLWNETKDAIIVDPGCYEPAEERILKGFIDENELKVVGLYNTHCHIDHVLGNQFVKDTYQVKLGVHPIEEKYLDAVPSYSAMYGFERYTHSKVDFYITEKDKLKFGKSELEILFVPGHSAGHLAFYSPEDGFCINGDVLFLNSIGRTDLPGGNMEMLLRSIHQVMFKLPEDTKVYTGHGEPTTIGFEKKTNPFCSL